MVFGIFARGCTHQATDRQIKTRRAILPLIATIRSEGPDSVGGLIVMQHMCDDAIDGGVAATALLIGHATGITEAGKDEAVDDASDFVLVAGEPSDRADRGWNEQKAIAVTRPKRLDVTR